MDGMAFVFPSLDGVLGGFARFHDLLSRDAVASFRYRALFQEAEGRPIRAHGFRRAVRDPHTRRVLAHDKLFTDLDRVMTSFFRRISGDDDPDLLARCFVVTRESQIADERLARISDDLLGRIRSVDTASGEQLTALVERVRVTQHNEFVLLVGTKGAGKSTFIDRFFRFVLPQTLRDECIIARVNVADSGGDEASVATWLDQKLLEVLEAALFGDEGPSFEEIEGMFWDEYQRRRTGTLRPLYERDRDAFKIDFGRHVERRREERPHEYIQRMVRHIVRVRQKIPCLIFDNADHFTIEFQERVFQYARSVYESAVCLVILPITDRTSWQLSREGALRSFESESLFLPTPKPRMVLQRRVAYLEAKLAEERREPGRGYFLQRGIPLSIENLTAFTAALQAIFLKNGQVASWIGHLANNDIRRCLEIARSVVSSPHIDVHELISTYLSGQSIDIPQIKIKRAMIKQQYDIYPGEENRYVRNIYALSHEVETSPLMGLRLLQLLEDARASEGGDAFVGIEQIIGYSGAMLVDDAVTFAWLGWMLDTGLCLSYDPTVTDLRHVTKLELSEAGSRHLRWGLRDSVYGHAMMQVTPLVDRDVYEQLCHLSQQQSADHWRPQLEVFIKYLIGEDSRLCAVPDHEAYDSQRRLTTQLREMVPARRPPITQRPQNQQAYRNGTGPQQGRRRSQSRPVRR